MTLTIGLIKASLPTYFPDQHGVFDQAVAGLEQLASAENARLVVAPTVPMDARQARETMSYLQAEGADFVLLLHGGFTMGDVARALAAYDMPLGFWATPEPVHEGDIQLNNFVSLNMSMSIARGVRDVERHPVRWYFGAPDGPALVAELRQTIRALTMRKALRGTRIGVVGGLAPTFYNMAVRENELLGRLGVEVEQIDMHLLTRALAAFADDAVAEECAAMAAAAAVDGVSDAHMALSARMVLALRSLAASGDYDALAVSDWPALQQDPGFYPGAAFSWLEERDRIPVASEGDVMGAVTQLVAKTLTGKVGCLLDMTSPQLAEDRILMWHGGGGPLYLADGPARWINHPMMGRGSAEGPVFGAIADYRFAPGPVTILRVGGSGSNQFAFEAQVVAAPESGFSGCRGWVATFVADGQSRSAGDIVGAVLGHGVEHHFILIPGHWQQTLNEFAIWANLAALEIVPRGSSFARPNL